MFVSCSDCEYSNELWKTLISWTCVILSTVDNAATPMATKWAHLGPNSIGLVNDLLISLESTLFKQAIWGGGFRWFVGRKTCKNVSFFSHPGRVPLGRNDGIRLQLNYFISGISTVAHW